MNADVLTFTYKPALLRRAVTYRLDGTQLTGPKGALDLSAVTQAALITHDLRGNLSTRLDLLIGGKRHSMSITIHRTTRKNDPDRLAHAALVLAVVGELARHNPETPVLLAEYGRARHMMFGVGVFSLLGGLGLMGAILVTGVSTDKALGAAFPCALLGLFGLALIYSNAPWRAAPSVSASQMAQALAEPDADQKV